MMSSDEESDEEENSKTSTDTRGDTPIFPINIFQAMNSHTKEFIFVLAVAFTTIAALQNGALNSRKANPPKPFFEEPTLITDFYKGEFEQLSSLILEKEVSLILYYAPWDAKSMSVRKEFETVAKFYHQEVFFAAINCWWPDGECSQKYKIFSYPLVMTFVRGIGGTRYEGIPVSSYMINFLSNVLSPFVYLSKTTQLLNLLTKHEGVLIGYFDFEKAAEPDGYQEFYSAAIHSLSKDPHRRLNFGVVTNHRSARMFNFKSMFKLHTWNDSIDFTNETWNKDDLLKWAYSKLIEVTQWVSPPGTKSKMLSRIIEKAATLIMFTPRTLLLGSVPYSDLLREVALEYENCNSLPEVTSLIHRIVLKRHTLQEELSKLIEKCHLSSPSYEDICETNPKSCDLTCCRSRNFRVSVEDVNCFCQICLHHTLDLPSKMKLAECENTLDLILKSIKDTTTLGAHDQCKDIEMSYPTKFGLYNRLSFKCQQEPDENLLNDKEKTLYNVESVKDDHILKTLKRVEEMACRKHKQVLNYSEPYFPEFPLKTDNMWRANFSGLKCKTNRTLLFILMDTVQFHSFAEKLGIDILNKHHQTAVIIVEAKQESTYLLEDYINKRTLIEFIKSYSSGTLDRFLRSTVHRDYPCPSEKGSICVKELTTSTFLDYILKNDTDVILMYYAAWCGACTSVAHIFLSVANYFTNIEKVKFARISGEDHDLPWEYTVEKYPTIILFPAFRKSDSVAFPSKLKITTTNLFHFVLANSQPSVRLLISMKLCNRDCVAYNLARSSSEVLKLFRDYKILLNKRHFLQQLKIGIQRGKRDAVENETLSYKQYLLKRIRSKRAKIKQAYYLRNILHKKREQYLKESTKESSHVESSREKTNEHITTTVLNSDAVSPFQDLKFPKDEL